MGGLFGGGGGPKGPPPSSFASDGAGATAAGAGTANVAGPSTITPGGVTTGDYQQSQGALGEQQVVTGQTAAPQVGGTSGGTYAPPAAGGTIVIQPTEVDQTTGSM